ncbi:MAG: hypothetical protein AB8G86_04980 [Saprospiraceae bacterium]
MEKLKSIELPKLGFSLKKMGDFLFHEGPIQSHFISDKDEDYLFFWADVIGNINRWMVVKSNPNLLHSFFTKKINTKDLITNNLENFVYFIDVNQSGEWEKIQLVANLDIPKTYYPSKDSYYIADHYEAYAQELSTYLMHYFARKEKIYSSNELELVVVQEPKSSYNPLAG